jgi:hypothetical protein
LRTLNANARSLLDDDFEAHAGARRGYMMKRLPVVIAFLWAASAGAVFWAPWFVPGEARHPHRRQ